MKGPMKAKNDRKGASKGKKWGKGAFEGQNEGKRPSVFKTQFSIRIEFEIPDIEEEIGKERGCKIARSKMNLTPNYHFISEWGDQGRMFWLGIWNAIKFFPRLLAVWKAVSIISAKVSFFVFVLNYSKRSFSFCDCFYRMITISKDFMK